MASLELLQALLRSGPRDANAICQALDISQPTFSRLWKRKGAGIVQIGKARASRYALLRPLDELGAELPLFRIDSYGSSAIYGKLTLLHGDHTLFTRFDGIEASYEGLPYFLQDQRPQGFLGRSAPRQSPELHLPQDIRQWNDDNVLQWAARRGIDAAGDLIVGNESYRRFHSTAPMIHMEEAREAIYPTLADRANLGDAEPGSSAAGEQPKFTTRVTRADDKVDHVIVKFSPPTDSDNGRRWADLLIAEHLALHTLQDHGIASCETQIVITERRLFLESVRYDRHGRRGRSPAITLAALDGITGAADKNWTDCAKLLVGEGRLGQTDAHTVAMLDVFGILIGNNDRHHGNLGFTWHDDGTLALAPAYDMLPMLYRPNTQGEIVPRHVDLTTLDRLDLQHLPIAYAMARDFWERVEKDERISEDFRNIATAHAAAIRMTP